MPTPSDILEAARALALKRTRNPAALRAALQYQTLLARWGHPVEAVAERLGVRAPLAAQLQFQAYRGWPPDISALLTRLPPGFVDEGCLSRDAAVWFFDQLLTRRPSSVFEVGCGLSTLFIAVAMERLRDPLRESRAFILSEFSGRVELVEQLLKTNELDRATTLFSSPLEPKIAFEHVARADLIFVGRSGFALGAERITSLVARAKSRATILLDAAADPERQRLLTSWISDGRVSLREFVVRDRGIAVLERGS